MTTHVESPAVEFALEERGIWAAPDRANGSEKSDDRAFLRRLCLDGDRRGEETTRQGAEERSATYQWDHRRRCRPV